MTDMPRPRSGILDIALYKGGASTLAGKRDVVKLSSNENPWGAPEAARAAAAEAAANLSVYPSGDHASLRAALGAHHGLDPEQIICGNGSGELLALLCTAYAGPGDEVIHTEFGFAMYDIYARAAGATPVVAPERARCVDVDAILALVTPRTKLIFLTNPANPTGTMLTAAELERLADEVPADVLLVIDSAYAEFADGYDGGAALAARRANVVMTRTFSKIYGLGGMRIGWAFGPLPIIEALMRIRGPFNLSVPALAAAEAALGATDFVADTARKNAELRATLAAQLARAGVPSDPSYANFILARFDSPQEAEACDAALRSEGIIVRSTASYGLPDCLRITIGRADACARVAEIITRFKGAPA